MVHALLTVRRRRSKYSDTTMTDMSTATPFLDKLKTANKELIGLYIFEQYLSPEEAEAAYEVMNNDIPWDLKPRLYMERLNQHAYYYKRYNAKQAAKMREKYRGVALLERICERIENEFDGRVEDIYCNRFQHTSHGIPWHHDTYGRHILVLSLGAPRKVQFRNDRKGTVSTLEPSSGDLYFFPLRVNDTHHHRVCQGVGTRMSFVFFFKPPKYAKELKITRMDKLKGKLTEIGVMLGA